MGITQEDNRDCINSNNAENEAKSRNINTSLLLKLAKTTILFLSWCCLGLYAEVLGPSLQTYINVTGTNSEEISKCFSMREMGMFFGSLLGAFFADRFIRYRHFTMSVTLILGAITIGAVPFCHTVSALSTTFFFSGFSHGAMTANGNPLLNSIWLEKSGGPFNFMHSGYGIGAAIAPGMLAPYTFTAVRTLPNGSTENTTLIHLETAYFIVAGLCCLVAGFFCCFSFCLPPKEGQSDASTLEDNEDVRHDFDDDKVIAEKAASKSGKMTTKFFRAIVAQKAVLLYIVFPTFFLFAALVGNERVFSKFIFVFANEGPAKLSKDDCLLLTGSYWIVFALARVITVPVSLLIPLNILFLIQLVGAWAMALALYLGPATRTAYLAFTICFGMFKSPLFPTALGVISLVTPITGIIAFFVNLGSSVGASALQAIAGSVLHRQGRHMFPLLVMISGAALIFIGAILVAGTQFYRTKCGSSPITTIRVPPDQAAEAVSHSF